MGISMGNKRRVKLFRNGRNQMVRIPCEFALPGCEAVLRKEGTRLIIEPVRNRSLLAVISRFKPLKASIPMIKDKPPESVDV
jgi:antitoxin VapB